MKQVTQILSAIEHGDAAAANELLPLVYDELRRLAALQLAREKAGHSLQPTALVHEAYLRLVDSAGSERWENRRHFYAAAAEAMRRILVENARRRASLKRGGDRQRQPLEESDLAAPDDDEALLALDEALSNLAKADQEAAQLVNLRYFSGLTMAQTAQAMNISPRSADRMWAYAKAWLLRELRGR